MEKYKLDQLFESLDRNCVKLILTIYILKVYGSLILYKFGLISAVIWENIHFIGIQLILIFFLFRLRSFTDDRLYAVGIGVFTSRLITQIMGGFELVYEMPFVIILSLTFYYLSQWNSKK